MKIFKSLLLAWIAVSLTQTPAGEKKPSGDICRARPGKFCYAPDLPASIRGLPGLSWTAHIPQSGGLPACGLPAQPTCYVWIPNRLNLSATVRVLNSAAVRADILSRDPKADVNHMERLK